MILLHALMAAFSLGGLWLRRAYQGVKVPLIATLAHPTGEPESRGTRRGQAVMGLANVVIGMTYFMLILFRTGHLR